MFNIMNDNYLILSECIEIPEFYNFDILTTPHRDLKDVSERDGALHGSLGQSRGTETIY